MKASGRPSSPTDRTALSPRRRRLRFTAWILSVTALAGLLAGGLIWRAHRPQAYQPGEASEDVTSELTKDLPSEAPRPKFADLTQAAGLGAFRNFAGDRTSQLPEDMGPGVAWGDFDNDGDEDVFLVSAGGALTLAEAELHPCELYENLGQGTFRRVDQFPETRIRGMGAAWGDYDGDGFLDLAVSGYNALRLFQNVAAEGGRQFRRDTRFQEPRGFWAGLCWGDYDNDRDLDLYVCGYVQYAVSAEDFQKSSEQSGSFVPYTLNPASFQPGLNLLFRNEGGGALREVGGELGVSNSAGRSLGGLWQDFDQDGWLDLYVANDVSDNVLYRNTGGAFVDISHPAWVADYRSAMGLAAGDYDRDGDDDLFITHWVAQENALYDNVWADYNLARAQRPAAAGANSGQGSQTNYPLRFVDANEMRGLGQSALPFVGWGAEFADVDGDGWLDLVVANGNTLEVAGPSPKRLKPQEPFLFWNRRGEHFHDLARLHPLLRARHVSRGLALADYDNDGDLDILLAHLGEGVQLLRNDMQTGNWIKLRLKSRSAGGEINGFGDGATVVVQAGEVQLRRTISSVSYLSQSSRIVHCGVGGAERADRVEVHWLGGGTNLFSDLAANTWWELREDDSIAHRVQTVSSSAGVISSPAPATQADTRSRLVTFWKAHRAGMNALKVEDDPGKAIPLFQSALDLDPDHEDARYYLAQCLVAEGKVEAALEHLNTLVRVNPQSHRGYQQLGVLRAIHARGRTDLESAHGFLERARAINPEETGALLALGEVALLLGRTAEAEQHFQAVCQSNSKSVGGLFLRAYLARNRRDAVRFGQLLEQARAALGPEWKPEGATSEGDTRRKHHVETSALERFWQQWGIGADAETVFAKLDSFLVKSQGKLGE